MVKFDDLCNFLNEVLKKRSLSLTARAKGRYFLNSGRVMVIDECGACVEGDELAPPRLPGIPFLALSPSRRTGNQHVQCHY